jgi:hypothetical protein
MLRNGSFVDPLRIQSPPAEPIPDAERPAFETARLERLALLDRPQAATVASGASPTAEGASP